jgi:hypothetical protein
MYPTSIRQILNSSPWRQVNDSPSEKPTVLSIQPNERNTSESPQRIPSISPPRPPPSPYCAPLDFISKGNTETIYNAGRQSATQAPIPCGTNTVLYKLGRELAYLNNIK